MPESCLYLVGTPIGNLGDISQRVRDVLTESDVVLAEDTRVSSNLLRHLNLKKQLLSCHDFNEEHRSVELEKWHGQNMKVALVSDAGMPLVSDPGYKIVQKAIDLGMTVCPVAGPSSALLALVGSGLPCDRFSFEGFLPDKAGERKRRLQKIRDDDRTLIFFVAPSALVSTLRDMEEVFGDRKACLAREITKLYEEFIRTTLSGIQAECGRRQLRGEFVLVVKGASGERALLTEAEIQERLQQLLKAGGRLKDASAILAAESGWPASQIYKLGLNSPRED
ncbi:MAG: 16S rRNA (cytidine(1402)-2'-O)-methyltransferase [Candidatus Obscuribacterales bacterium]|nr:16S rRNA (cytidine(1402)-2'-O)-methyltransferase [Candidatus Obscuribacterales bacterium]